MVELVANDVTLGATTANVTINTGTANGAVTIVNFSYWNNVITGYTGAAAQTITLTI